MWGPQKKYEFVQLRKFGKKKNIFLSELKVSVVVAFNMPLYSSISP